MEITIEGVPASQRSQFLAWMHPDQTPQSPSLDESIQEREKIIPNAWHARKVTLHQNGINVRKGFKGSSAMSPQSHQDYECAAGAYCLLYPGNLGGLVGPRWDPGVPIDIVVDILQAVIQSARTAGAKVIQSILDQETNSREGILCKAGMKKLADLEQMVAAVPCNVAPRQQINQEACSEQPSPWRWKMYSQEDLPLWLDLIEQTYRFSMDCPELNGLRSTQDTLLGYQAVAHNRTSQWWLLFYRERAVACVLLSPFLPTVWELTYMGVHPDFRGKGIGKRVMSYAIEQAKNAKVELLLLSSDSRNSHAIQLYSQFGFHTTQTLQAWFTW